MLVTESKALRGQVPRLDGSIQTDEIAYAQEDEDESFFLRIKRSVMQPRVSLWEIEDENFQAQHIDDVFVDVRGHGLREDEVDVLAQVLALHQKDERYALFLQDVSFQDEPFYPHSVPFPMSLETMSDRLQNNYYRCVSSFLHDSKMIMTACKCFNVDGSAIVQLSEELSSSICSKVQALLPDSVIDSFVFP